jgi:hypothetical protein
LISGHPRRFKDVGILGFDIGPDEIVGALFALWVGARLGVLTAQGVIRLAQTASRRISRRRAPPPPPPEPPRWPPDWRLSLLVRLDEGEGVLHPSVQVRGLGEQRRGRIRLELVDGDGDVRLAVKRPFPATALNTELPLPSFAPPEGANPAEVLGWRWDITLTIDDEAALHWHEFPSPTGVLNVEAELHDPERAGAGAPGEPWHRSPAEAPGTNDLGPQAESRALVFRKRARRLLLAIVLIVYIIVVYSGPTGEVSAPRALLLYGAFAAIWVALWALCTALFAEDADLVPEIEHHPGDHTPSSGGTSRSGA